MSLKATQKCVATSLSLSWHTLTQPHTCDLPVRSSVFAPLPSPKNESLWIWPRELYQLYNLDLTCPLYSPLYIQGSILFREILFYPLYITCPHLENEQLLLPSCCWTFFRVKGTGWSRRTWLLALETAVVPWRCSLVPAWVEYQHPSNPYSAAQVMATQHQCPHGGRDTNDPNHDDDLGRHSWKQLLQAIQSHQKTIRASRDLNLLAPVRFVHPKKIQKSSLNPVSW